MGKDHTMEFIYMTRWRLRGENVNAVLLLINGVWGFLLPYCFHSLIQNIFCDLSKRPVLKNTFCMFSVFLM